MNERTAHLAMDETAEWSSQNVIKLHRVMQPRRNELQRYVIEGTYRREEKNPRLGLLILAVSASTFCFGLYWIFK